MSDTKKYHIWANSGGCPQNQLDGAQTADFLEKQGYSWTDKPENADFLVINSCAYHQIKENESAETVRDFQCLLKKDTKLLITGCLPKIAPDRFNENGNIVIPATELHKLPEQFPSSTVTWDGVNPNHIPEQLFQFKKPFRRLVSKGLRVLKSIPFIDEVHIDRLLMYDHTPQTFIVRIAEGCLGGCSYCAIRFSRGRLVSKSEDQILAEVKQGIDSGAKYILLTATELSAYGRDKNTNLAELLYKILAMDNKIKLNLFYANPRWLIDIWPELEPAFASKRIHFIHLSLNGSSDKILKSMHRGYTIEEFEDLVININKVSPDTILQTQVITGYPDETKEDFDIVSELLKRNYFHNVQIHAFDPRPGTEAANLPDQIPEPVRNKRRNILYFQTLTQKLRWNLLYMSGKNR